MEFDQALYVLESCFSSKGLMASPEKVHNYKRVWARDSMITSLALLMLPRKDYREQVKKSLITLIKSQSDTGQIPSNVSLTGKVSYGQSTGRVDANLWFVIGFSQYVKRTNDLSFLEAYIESIEKVMFLLKCYEFNGKGFIYTPKSGNWADEYLQEGYVLYDEVLYYRALVEYDYLLRILGRKDKNVIKKANLLKKMIVSNFWPNGFDKYVYFKPVFKKAVRKKYLLAYFNPAGYGSKFDGFGNSLALHFNILDKKRELELRNFVNNHFSIKTGYLLPAFHPAITKEDKSFELLRNNYSNIFKNKPYEYHNGGLWPVITGFYATTSKEEAGKYFQGIVDACKKDNWSFPEFINSKNFRPGGTRFMAWSAASIIMTLKYLEGNEVFI